MPITVDCGEGKHELCHGRGRTAYLFPQESRDNSEPPFDCGCVCHHVSHEIIQSNIWSEDMPNENPPTEFMHLEEHISFDGFKYDHTYREQEVELLQPQLEALGYNVIKWMPGETDSFGPLTRICKASKFPNQYSWFIYG